MNKNEENKKTLFTLHICQKICKKNVGFFLLCFTHMTAEYSRVPITKLSLCPQQQSSGFVL